MHYIVSILRRFLLAEPQKVLLGRWNIEHCNHKMNHKVDLANEDHCGPCGQYVFTKLLKEDSKKIKNDFY